MGKLRFLAALWVAKLSIIALKLTGHKGTDFPGAAALKVCPQFLKYIGKPKQIVAVTGTNGKTTVNNLLIDALTADGKKVVSNNAGSNINSGIATSLIRNASIFGKCKGDIGSFEIDERSARTVYPYMKPDHLIITNLSRDSIMRNAHPEYISDILTKYIPKETKLIVNADDLFCSTIAPDNDRVYFGIERMASDKDVSDNLINDYQICPECHTKLKYEYVRYSHIGRAYCPSCGFHAPDYDYTGCDVDTENMTITIKDSKGSEIYPLLNDSVYNIYNVLSVVVLLSEMGYSKARIREFLEKIDIVGTRFDEEVIGDKTVYMMLAKEKNAFGTSRVFDYISQQTGDIEVILANSCQGDAKHWSENTCWMYDCDFEMLNRVNIKNIVVTGPRGKDHKLRLLLAGVPEEKISYTANELDSPDMAKLFENDNIYVLYGTDSIALGKKIADKVKEKIRGGERSVSQ